MNDKFVSAPTLKHISVYNSWTIFVTCLDVLNKLSHTLVISAVIKNDKSVNVAQLKDILNFYIRFQETKLNFNNVASLT